MLEELEVSNLLLGSYTFSTNIQENVLDLGFSPSYTLPLMHKQPGISNTDVLILNPSLPLDAGIKPDAGLS